MAVVLTGCGSITPTASPGTSGPTRATIPRSGTTAAVTPSTSTPRIGPGSLATYTVQHQRAPGSCHYKWVGTYPLPDPTCTPGAVDPQVTPSDLDSTICRAGWTSTVRPPERITGPEKAGSAAAYGYIGPWATAEYDHLVPLELGGDPNDPANLWLEPNDRPGATSFTNSKDALETTLHDLVCSGQLSLAAAQEAIATDWVAAFRRYGI